MEFVSMGWNKQMGGAPVGFLPSDLANLELWTRFNQGITVTGSGVSQWDDQSGNGNHLKQGTDTNRPSEEADGSILFGGGNDFLKTDAFTLEQPETIYLLCKSVTWTDFEYFFDGNTGSTGLLYQRGVTPEIQMFAGTAVNSSTALVVGNYGAVSVVFNGANSYLQVNDSIVGPNDAGALDMGGFTLGAKADSTQASNIQVKEALVYSEAHDAAQRAQVIGYLQSI